MAGIICERCKQEIKNPFDPVPIGEYILFKNVGGYDAVDLCDDCCKELTKIVQVFLGEKEPECKDCRYHVDGSWRSRKDGEALAECHSPLTKYGFCSNNCNDEKACPHFEKKE